MRIIRRDLDLLRDLRGTARRIGQSLERNSAFQHPRISLPIGEAGRHAAQLEAFLTDALETAEAEIYRGPGKPKE